MTDIKTEVKIIQGDITKLKVDAIVNAANESLLGGSGVDGAIHAVAGPELKDECAKLNGCKTGEAKITKGYNLPAKYIIHTVGPVYDCAGASAEVLLANCYKNSLKLARENGIRSIAFPAIATGAYRYPKEAAARIAINTVKEFIKANPDAFDEIVFALYDRKSLDIYESLMK